MKRLFLICLILCMLAVSTGCKQAFPTAEGNKQGTSPTRGNKQNVTTTGPDIKIAYGCIDYPVYNSAEEINQIATHIFKGKVTRVFFEVLNLFTSQPPKLEDKYCQAKLFTVYEIEVTAKYKGEVAETEYICVVGGLETMLAEQKQIMEKAGIYDPLLGVVIYKPYHPLSVGSSYFFSVAENNGEYRDIINQSQFAMALNEKDTQQRVTPEQIKEYLKSNP